MTREEAIQILSTRDAHGVLCGYTSGVTEALDMAIEALTYQNLSKPNNSDLISRAEAIKELQKRVEMIGYDDNDEMIYGIDADRAMSAIEGLSSAEAVHCEECDHCVYKWA